MPTLFRRKPAADLVESAVTGTVGDDTTGAKPKAYTPSKRERGVVTPKRTGTTSRRVAAAPTNRKEAAAQSRERRRAERQAMMNGEEWALLPRDRGPERALVRDVVDSRRNVGTYLFGALFAFSALSFINVQLAVYGELVFLLLIAVTAVDVYILSRRIKRTVLARMPKATPRWGGLYWYAGTRAISFRGMRAPRPKVKVGQAI